jgi:hypothetical protein
MGPWGLNDLFKPQPGGVDNACILCLRPLQAAGDSEDDDVDFFRSGWSPGGTSRPRRHRRDGGDGTAR